VALLKSLGERNIGFQPVRQTPKASGPVTTPEANRARSPLAAQPERLCSFLLFVFFCPDFLRSNGQNGIVGPCTNWRETGGLISAYKTLKSRHICPSFYPYKTVSAKGATFTLAWGSAPGSRKRKSASAESAIHSFFRFITASCCADTALSLTSNICGIDGEPVV